MDLIKLEPFPSVSASGTCTLSTSQLQDRSVHALVFEQGGTFTKAQMEDIRLRLDGKNILGGFTGQNIQDLNDYDGLPDESNYLVYFFGDPTATTFRGQHLGDLDLSIYRKPLEVQVDIGAATSPTLQVYALASVPKMAMGVGFTEKEAAQFRTIRKSTAEPTGAVSQVPYQISYGAGARIRKLGFFHSNLTSVNYKKGSITKFDDASSALNEAVQKQFARVPQSGLYVLDFTVDGHQGEAETTVKPNGEPWNLAMELSTSGADTIGVAADFYASWPQL